MDTCQQCGSVPIFPVHVCREGHNLCAPCYEVGMGETAPPHCGACGDQVWTRNRSLEGIIHRTGLKVKCPYRGCRESVGYGELQRHMALCDKRPMACPGCCALVYTEELPTHCRSCTGFKMPAALHEGTHDLLMVPNEGNALYLLSPVEGLTLLVNTTKLVQVAVVDTRTADSGTVRVDFVKVFGTRDVRDLTFARVPWCTIGDRLPNHRLLVQY